MDDSSPVERAEVEPVLAEYPDDCQPLRSARLGIEALGAAGGYSGASLWRLATARGLLCLRRWPPEHPDLARLEFVHAVLRHVREKGFLLAPHPIRTRGGAEFVRRAGRFWELTPWLPGRADYRSDSRPEKLEAALETLARFHLAAADFGEGPGVRGQGSGASGGGLTSPGRKARVEPDMNSPSPGIAYRLSKLAALRGGEMQQLVAAIQSPRIPPQWAELAGIARRLLPLFAKAEPAVDRQLAAANRLRVPLQPCIRDIWHDHVLFQGVRVSGLVDFGAMHVDTVAADVARLLGSLAADDTAARRLGLAAYQALRPLSADELQLVEAFDRSTVLISGINWLEWVFVQQRSFEDPADVTRRVARILGRLGG